MKNIQTKQLTQSTCVYTTLLVSSQVASNHLSWFLTSVAQTEPKCYTVEEAVESIDFGLFHILLFVIMGSANVRKLHLCNSLASILCFTVYTFRCWCAVCVDSGGNGDHVVGCGFSWDPLRMASRGLAGGPRLHGEELVQSKPFILISLWSLTGMECCSARCAHVTIRPVWLIFLYLFEGDVRRISC